MNFPERFSNLPEYAFPRLRGLLDSHAAGGDVTHMTIGEPQHDFPDWVLEIIAKHSHEFRKYPPNAGAPELRSSIAAWIKRRFGVVMDAAEEITTVNGTREGLYNAAMALCPEAKNGQKPVILTPNPFYQVYAVAALSVNAEPVYVPADAENGFLPDYAGLSEDVLNRTAIAYICSPSNPQGAVASREYWQQLIELAEKYNFQIFADECYSEIYRDTPPVGALQVARDIGADPERVLIFHSLSKRSNLPGLRSGFIAGGPKSIARIKQLRDFSGSPIPLPLQRVSTRAWADEAHVEVNRELYREKFIIADEIFGDLEGYVSPEAGFFLWLPVPDGEAAALHLWQQTGVRVLPGAYLSRDIEKNKNPGHGYIRVAMVAPKTEMQHGLIRLKRCLYS